MRQETPAYDPLLTPTRFMGATVSRKSLFRILRRLENRGKGILPSVKRALEGGRRDLLVQAAVDLIDQRLQPALEGSRERGVRVFSHLEEVMRGNGDPMLRMEPDFADHAVFPVIGSDATNAASVSCSGCLA